MKTFLLPVLVIAAVCMAGCKNRLVFVTQTSTGLDISGTANYPNKISFSYNRQEAAIVPRKTDGSGESQSVYGGMDSDVKFALPPRYRIDQVFATGEAAALAAGRDTEYEGESVTPSEDQSGDRPNSTKHSEDKKGLSPLIFVTSTTLGIHLTAGEQELNPTALVGYRRTEATTIPIPDSAREVSSVYADIHLSSGEADAVKAAKESHQPATGQVAKTVADEREISQWGGVRIKQSFATGKAAEILAASSDEVKTNLLRAVGLSAVADVKKLEREGQQLGDEVNSMIDALPDAKLDAAGQAAFEAKLFVGTLAEFTAQTPEKKRQQFKSVVTGRTSSRDQAKLKRFKSKLKTL